MEIGCGLEDLCFHPDPRVLFSPIVKQKQEGGGGYKDTGWLGDCPDWYITIRGSLAVRQVERLR